MSSVLCTAWLAWKLCRVKTSSRPLWCNLRWLPFIDCPSLLNKLWSKASSSQSVSFQNQSTPIGRGSSSGRISDNGSRSPKFHSPLGAGLFFSSLSYHSLSEVHPLTGPSWRCNTTDFQLSKKNEGLADQKFPSRYYCDPMLLYCDV